MKRYKVSPEETSFYYSTCTIVAWLPVFQSEPYFQIIINSLNYCRANKGLLLLGFIIMPTHMHMVTSNHSDTILSEIMRDFRAYTSRKIRKQLELDGRESFLKVFENSARNLPKQQYRIWQEDYHPVALYSEDWFHQKMNYMHDNPVRIGFVDLPEHWKYSSARNWILDDDRLISIDRQCLFEEG
ncbi:transposase [candidate division KSB1 bacterium]|nr:transposase [candidate division KSB1 bacterium]